MKRAIVLSGGGARGSYEVGVWKALKELGITYDIVTGTSVGALNGCLMAQDDIETGYKMWENLETGNILEFEITQDIKTVEGMLETLNSFAKEAFKTRGVGSAPLHQLLDQLVDEDKIRKSPIVFGIVTLEVPSMKPHQLTMNDIPEGKLVDYLIASSSCFPAMQGYEIDGKYFIDGGYFDNTPVAFAVENGADEVIAVGLKAVGVVRKLKFKDVKVNIIEPRWDLGAMFIFDGSRAKRNIALGYYECMKHYDQYDGCKYTFFKGEAEKNSHVYALFKAYFDKINIDIDAKTPANFTAQLNTVNEYLAKYAIMKAIKKRWRNKNVTMADSITAAAEAAGEVFEINPIEIYTFEDFNFKIMNRFGQFARLPYNELGIDINSALSVKECIANISKTISPVSAQNRLLYIISCLMDEEKLEQNKRLLTMLAVTAPVEFMAGIYIVALTTLVK